jgi:two-component system cell cycle response regulator
VQCFTELNAHKTIAMFNQLIDHVVNHFENEERVLHEFNYKDLEEHKKIHQDLINKTLLLQKQLIKGQLTPINVAKYLVQDVVVGHIIKSDFEFYDLFPRKSL